MARSPTVDTWRALSAQFTSSAFIALLSVKFYNGTDYDCIYVCNNLTNVDSSAEDGTTHKYIGFPVAITPPSSTSTAEGSIATLTISGIGRELIDKIRSVTVPMVVNITSIHYDEPNEALAKWHCYTWRNLTYDSMDIVGQISLENFTSEPYPGIKFTPAITPGLFR